MKKFSLLTLAFLSMAYAQAADDTTVFGYCGEIGGNFGGIYENCGFSAAIEIPEITASTFEGRSLTAVSIGFGTATNREVEIFLTYDLKNGDPFYTQTATLEQNQFTEVKLDTPYVVDGKPFFVGYKYIAYDYCTPYVTDMDPNGGNPLGNWKSIPWMQDPSNGDFRAFYEHNYENQGNNCIRLILEGEQEVKLSAEVTDVKAPYVVTPGEEFFSTVSVANTSSVDIENVTIAWTVGEDSFGTAELKFDTPVTPGATGRGSIMMYGSDMEDEEMPMTFTVTKVNGEDNLTADRVFTSKIMNTANGIMRRVVIEKHTGMGCGWCPRAMYAFDRLKDEVTDGSFLPVEVHNYQQSDPLYCSAYNAWRTEYQTGSAPSATFNRVSGINTGNTLYSQMNAQYQLLHLPTFVEIKVEANMEDNQVKATTTTFFTKDFPSHDYGIGFIITEDDLGPYAQNNNYGNSKNPDAGPYGNMGGVFITYYDDVARDIIDMKGAYGSLPTSIEAGEAYTYNKQLTLPKVEDWKKCSLTAFVANRLTGEIINANRVRLDPENIPDSVEGVSSDLREIKAMVENGNLSVEGNYSEARVYALDGTAVATLLQGDRVALGSGVYVVKAACAGGKDKVLKVMVK